MGAGIEKGLVGYQPFFLSPLMQSCVRGSTVCGMNQQVEIAG